MTPSFHWVFLLALVGRAASVPRPLIVDACALLCNPGAETESEQERDPVVFPRYPKVNCKLQSDSDKDQAWVIASHCLKLCNSELSISSEVNCFAMRSSLQAHLGCYCEALTPLSPNTMRLHESWRLNFLVKELADDILNVLLTQPLDAIILCMIHQELFTDQVNLKGGKLVEKCLESKSAENFTFPRNEEKREKRETEKNKPGNLPPAWKDLDLVMNEETVDELAEEEMKTEDKLTEEEMKADDTMMMDESTFIVRETATKLEKEDPSLTMPEEELFRKEDNDMYYDMWIKSCKGLCKSKEGKKYCPCDHPLYKRLFVEEK